MAANNGQALMRAAGCCGAANYCHHFKALEADKTILFS